MSHLFTDAEILHFLWFNINLSYEFIFLHYSKILIKKEYIKLKKKTFYPPYIYFVITTNVLINKSCKARNKNFLFSTNQVDRRFWHARSISFTNTHKPDNLPEVHRRDAQRRRRGRSWARRRRRWSTWRRRRPCAPAPPFRTGPGARPRTLWRPGSSSRSPPCCAGKGTREMRKYSQRAEFITHVCLPPVSPLGLSL